MATIVIHTKEALGYRGCIPIGRGSDWGNYTFTLGKTCKGCGEVHDRDPLRSVLTGLFCYQRQLVKDMSAKKINPSTLYGKALACFCKRADGSELCHGDVLGLAASHPDEVRIATLHRREVVGLCHHRSCDGWWSVDPCTVLPQLKYSDVPNLFRCDAHQRTSAPEVKKPAESGDWSRWAAQMELAI